MSQTRLLLCVVFALLLAACATPPSAPTEQPVLPSFGDSSRFGARPNLPTPEELHRLTPAQEQEFLAYFNHPLRANVAPHLRLYRHLDALVEGFNYQGATLNAMDALASNSGNCLSLAILTTALAELAGIEIRYQLMDDQPVFEYQGSVVRKGVHVSSIVYNPEMPGAGNSVFDLSGYALRIDYFPMLKGRFVANLDRNGYLALYYNNIASDAIAANDYSTAYWYLLEALNFAPADGATLNMLAVVNRRVGDSATAENIYRYGIAHVNDKLSLLKNYHTLLLASGRDREAAEIARQLQVLDDPSPFHWLQLARASHDDGDWESAIEFYRRALTLAPYMHEVQLGLAQAYYGAGRLRSAEGALNAAVSTANKVSTRNLYEAKLAALQKEL